MIDKESKISQDSFFGHPLGLRTLFFTELWERMSYYGMRGLLVLYMTIGVVGNPGLGWSNIEANAIYGIYAGMVYFLALPGGWLADNLLGYQKTVLYGALIIMLGHFTLAIPLEQTFILGLAFVAIGTGLLKPNISSIVGQLYKDDDIRKDGAYTIFYMGINAGAFLGILLCGYLGEKVGWHWGFGLAGIFMFFGMLQFYYAQEIFGSIGLKPEKKAKNSNEEVKTPITSVEWDRISVILVFSAATIFFWWAFEQAGGSMTIFANDYTERNLTGESATIFKTVNTIITIVPMAVITYVLYKLFQNIFQKYFISNFFLGTSFVIIWGIVIWMIDNEFSQEATEIPASWFSVLNSLFIILFAPVFSKIWASKYNPSGPIKFSIGLILLGLGFGFLAYGSMSIPYGAQTASVSIFWLVFAYLFHTLGELCVSPVGLSYVSKLAPVRLVGLMFGFWLLSSFFANLIGGVTGSYINIISEKAGLSGFFLIFTLIPIGAGIIMFLLNGFLKKRMHGFN